jgi:hypothetical protein
MDLAARRLFLWLALACLDGGGSRKAALVTWWFMETIQSVFQGSADQDLSSYLGWQLQSHFYTMRVCGCAFAINKIIRVGRKDIVG